MSPVGALVGSSAAASPTGAPEACPLAPGLPVPPRGGTLVMGILNVTPDSFSDGGLHAGHEAAVAHGLAMVRDGADLVDVGGESTRPGAAPVDPAQEQERILPVIADLAAEGVAVSVDTLHPSTARAALAAGAHLVNDVSGQRLDPEMVALCAETGAPYVLTHARGDSATMDGLADYADTVAEVCQELEQLRDRLVAGGVAPEQIILDPGLGFAKGGDQDWQLLAGLDRIRALGHPVLVAASRKRFLGTALAADLHREVAPRQRDGATAAVSALAAAHGAWAVRVHDVPATVQALAVARRWNRAAQHVASRAGHPVADAAPASAPAPAAASAPAAAAGRDRITLTGVGSVGHHGVLEQEKRVGQPFFVDAVLHLDLAPAGTTDSLEHTVDYGRVAETIKDIVVGTRFDLIESLAEAIAAALLQQHPLRAVEITVHKPKAPIEVTFADVSVTVFRERA